MPSSNRKTAAASAAPPFAGESYQPYARMIKTSTSLTSGYEFAILVGIYNDPIINNAPDNPTYVYATLEDRPEGTKSIFDHNKACLYHHVTQENHVAGISRESYWLQEHEWRRFDTSVPREYLSHQGAPKQHVFEELVIRMFTAAKAQIMFDLPSCLRDMKQHMEERRLTAIIPMAGARRSWDHLEDEANKRARTTSPHNCSFRTMFRSIWARYFGPRPISTAGTTSRGNQSGNATNTQPPTTPAPPRATTPPAGLSSPFNPDGHSAELHPASPATAGSSARADDYVVPPLNPKVAAAVAKYTPQEELEPEAEAEPADVAIPAPPTTMPAPKKAVQPRGGSKGQTTAPTTATRRSGRISSRQSSAAPEQELHPISRRSSSTTRNTRASSSRATASKQPLPTVDDNSAILPSTEDDEMASDDAAPEPDAEDEDETAQSGRHSRRNSYYNDDWNERSELFRSKK